MMAIRNIAIKEGNTHPIYKSYVETLDKFGRLLEVGEFENEKRRKLGLPELESNPERVHKLFDLTEIRDKVEGKKAEQACETKGGSK